MNESQEVLARVAKKLLQDPVMMQRLSDRVYELLQEDLRKQKERSCRYGNS